MSPGNRVKLFRPQSLPPNGIVPPARPHLLNLCKCCHPLWTKCSNAETTGDVSHLIHSIELSYLPSTSLARWSRISHFSLASLISCLLRYLLPCTPMAPSRWDVGTCLCTSSWVGALFHFHLHRQLTYSSGRPSLLPHIPLRQTPLLCSDNAGVLALPKAFLLCHDLTPSYLLDCGQLLTFSPSSPLWFYIHV